MIPGYVTDPTTPSSSAATVLRHRTPSRLLFEVLADVGVSATVERGLIRPYTHLVTTGSVDDARALAAHLLCVAEVSQLMMDGPLVHVVMSS